MFAILSVFGLLSFVGMVSKGTFAGVRSVDAVQLLGTGMCFGAALVALVFFLRSAPGVRPNESR